MTLSIIKRVVWIVIICGIGAFVFISCGPSVSRLRFLLRSHNYYAKVADACEHLVSQAAATPREIRESNLQKLPPVLQELKPYRVIVQTNCVIVRIGAGQASYMIIWCADEADGTEWQLRVSGVADASRRIVFSRKRMKEK